MIEHYSIGYQSQYTESPQRVKSFMKPTSTSTYSTDKIVRIKDDCIIASASTESIAKPLAEIFYKYSVLKKAFKNLWKKDRYNREYISYLLGSYNEKEFMEIARKYAEQNEEIDEKELLSSFKILCSIIKTPITSYEMSYLLNADCSEIDKKMTSALGEND